MTQILEDINNHPKEIKRVIGITDKQFQKLIENAQSIAKTKKWKWESEKND